LIFKGSRGRCRSHHSRIVAEIFRGRLAGGYHEMTFQNPGLPSGVYLYRLEMGANSQSRKLQIIK
jgi:hypothetical protein